MYLVVVMTVVLGYGEYYAARALPSISLIMLILKNLLLNYLIYSKHLRIPYRIASGENI